MTPAPTTRTSSICITRRAAPPTAARKTAHWATPKRPRPASQAWSSAIHGVGQKAEGHAHTRADGVAVELQRVSLRHPVDDQPGLLLDARLHGLEAPAPVGQIADDRAGAQLDVRPI